VNSGIDLEMSFTQGVQNLGLSHELAHLLWIPLPMLLVLVSAVIGVLVTVWLERKISAAAQQRIGPEYAGALGILQPMADGLKLLVKEDIIPARADSVLFTVGPILVLVPVILSWLIVPFGQNLLISNVGIGIFLWIALSSIQPIGLLMSGYSSNNKYFPCKRILTGHTATDRAETIIMNIARGSDLIGLSTLKEKRILENNIELARPLLIFNRDETLEICKEFNLPIWIDPSNENLNLTRNKIRKEILPILNSIYKGADSRIASMANRLESYNEDQESFARIAIDFCKEEQINSLSRKKITNYTNSIRKIILSNWLKMIGVKRVTALQIEEINNKISQGKQPGIIHLQGDFHIRWNKETIYISKKTI